MSSLLVLRFLSLLDVLPVIRQHFSLFSKTSFFVFIFAISNFLYFYSSDACVLLLKHWCCPCNNYHNLTFWPFSFCIQSTVRMFTSPTGYHEALKKQMLIVKINSILLVPGQKYYEYDFYDFWFEKCVIKYP